MNRRTLLPIMATLGMLMFCTGGREAHAQANACCTFTVVASNTVPASCLPITVRTSWGTSAVVQNNTVTVNGPNPFAITAPCPPIPTPFDWVSLDGGVTTIPFGTPTQFVLPCGTCVVVFVGYDAGLPPCILIRITACP